MRNTAATRFVPSDVQFAIENVITHEKAVGRPKKVQLPKAPRKSVTIQ